MRGECRIRFIPKNRKPFYETMHYNDLSKIYEVFAIEPLPEKNLAEQIETPKIKKEQYRLSILYDFQNGRDALIYTQI